MAESPTSPNADSPPPLPTSLVLAQAGEASAVAPLAATEDDEGPPVNDRRFRAAVLRHKWLVVALTVLGLGA